MKLLCLILIAGAALAQIPKGTGGGGGGSGTGAVNAFATCAGPGTSCAVTISSLNINSLDSALIACKSAAGADLPVLTAPTVGTSPLTTVTPTWSASTANVTCTVNSNGGAGPTGQTGTAATVTVGTTTTGTAAVTNVGTSSAAILNFTVPQGIQGPQGNPGTGSVLSVALTMPSWLTVSGSPITTSGTLAVTAASGQTANQFLGTPNGSTGAATLRAILAADLPTISLLSGVTGTLPVANGGTGVTSAQGTGSKVQLSTGSATTGHCVQFDGTGNTVDAGAACGSGGGGGATYWQLSGTTTLAVTAGAAHYIGTVPAIVAASSSASAAITSGTGTIFVNQLANGTIDIVSNILIGTCTGCTAVVGTAYEANSCPLGSATVASGSITGITQVATTAESCNIFPTTAGAGISKTSASGSDQYSLAASFANLSGNIDKNQMNGGSGATTSTFWRGDGTWQPVSGGTARTWAYTFAGNTQAGSSGFAINTPASNAPIFTNAGGTVPITVLEWPTAQSTYYAWATFLLPTGYVSNAAVSYSIEYRSADSTHAAILTPSIACIGTSAVLDNPTFGATPTANLTAGASSHQTIATGTWTPNTGSIPACAAGQRMFVKILVDTNTNAMTQPFDLVSATFSVTGAI